MEKSVRKLKSYVFTSIFFSIIIYNTTFPAICAGYIKRLQCMSELYHTIWRHI